MRAGALAAFADMVLLLLESVSLSEDRLQAQRHRVQYRRRRTLGRRGFSASDLIELPERSYPKTVRPDRICRHPWRDARFWSASHAWSACAQGNLWLCQTGSPWAHFRIARD